MWLACSVRTVLAFAVSSRVMRRILVHAARAKGSGKRGGGVQRLNLNEAIDAMPAPTPARNGLPPRLDERVSGS
jgi:hypothetical protein